MRVQSHFRSVRAFLSSPIFIYLSLALSFWLGLGSIHLFDLDEGAFTEATREMLSSGIYAATYLDGEPRYDKPILFYWLQALSIISLGFNEWAYRAPSAFMACLWALSVYRFVKEFFSAQKAIIAAVFLINCLWVAMIARSAIADATLNLFLTLTLFDIWRYFSRQQKNECLTLPATTNPLKTFFNRYGLTLRIYLWMALASLTKGPVAVAFPLVISLLFLFSSRAPRRYYGAYVNPLGWLVYIAVVSPWLWAVYLEQGSGFFQGFLLEHNLKRFSDTRESHGGTLLYYVYALPLILMPLSGLLISLSKRSKQLIKLPLSRYLLIWFAVIFTLFSFSKTQLPHYILNGCVPLIILLAVQTPLFHRNRWTLAVPQLLMLVLIFLPQIVALNASNASGFVGATLSRHQEVFTNSYTMWAGLALVLMLFCGWAGKLATWQRLALNGMILNVFVFTILVRIIFGLQQTPVHDAINFLKDRNGDETVVAYKMQMPTFSVYRAKITPLRAPKPGEIAITRVDRFQKLVQHIGSKHAHILFQSGGLLLVKNQPSADTPASQNP